MKKKLLIFLEIASATIWLFCGVEPNKYSSQNPLDWNMPVGGVEASYDKNTDKVIIRWNIPKDFDYDFFTLYRLPLSGVFSEKIDISLLDESVGIWKKLNKLDSIYIDTPGVSNIVFFYALRAARFIDQAKTKFVEGCFSDSSFDTVVVGADVSFNINFGDVYLVTPQCNLVLNDYARRVEHVRFTQQVRTYLIDSVKGISKEVTNFDNPWNPPSNNELKLLVAQGWIQNTGQFPKKPTGHYTVYLDSVPDFDAVDTQNAHSGKLHEPVSTINVYPWQLKLGNGRKRVYAEVTFKNGDLDTLQDYIDIQPYRITIKMQNKTGSSDETMRCIKSEAAVGRLGAGDMFYIIYKKIVEFSVSIYADTTISPEFYYWLLTSDSSHTIDFNIVTPKTAWLETTPLRGELTGGGGFFHDDNYVYRYRFDSRASSAAGNDLNSLRRTYQKPGTSTYNVPVAFKFIGSELFNETAIPGSYWGENPRRWNSGDTALMPVWDTIAGDEHSLDSHFVNLAQDELYGRGRKEFAIIALFKGKYFQDIRTIISNKKSDGQYGMRTYLDVYPPEVNISEKEGTGLNPDYLTENSVIIAPFNYALSKQNSIIDQGFANITKAYLIIAQKPVDFLWDEKSYRTVPLDTLFTMRYEIFPYDIKSKSFVLQKVRWDNIDPLQWPSGQYIMGIVASDEFGNEDFAIANEQLINNIRPAYPNPWLVTLLSGR